MCLCAFPLMRSRSCFPSSFLKRKQKMPCLAKQLRGLNLRPLPRESELPKQSETVALVSCAFVSSTWTQNYAQPLRTRNENKESPSRCQSDQFRSVRPEERTRAQKGGK